VPSWRASSARTNAGRFHERISKNGPQAIPQDFGRRVDGAGAGGAPWRGARAQAGPIKIGLLAPLTGVVASGGREMVEGVQFYLDQVKGQIAGRKVELVIEDDASNPDTALQKARRLVEQGNCHMLMGDLLANTGLAVANYVKGTGTPYFIPIIAADDLTQRQRIKNVIRVAGYSASAFTHPFGDWALKQGYRKLATISQDYTFGHEQCGGLAQVFTEGGGQIVQQFWHPLNTADFSPYLGQLADLKVDAIFAMETGADATRLIQQYASFGLKGNIPLLGAMNATDQSVIRTLGDECEGIIAAAHFAEGADNPVTQKFVRDYEAKYGKIPSLYGFSMYSGIMWVAGAIEKLGGKVEDRELLIDTVLKTELTGSPLGKTVTLDAYGNPIYDVQIRKVVKRADGKFWNVPTTSYPNVSQFWTYDPETYMKQPPYSRTFQGIKKT
jgi:branched-chain amino acid transport system substrate-binding protein